MFCPLNLFRPIEEDLQETQPNEEVQTEDIPKPEPLVLEPEDQLLQQLGTPTDSKVDGFEQKKNVLDKITDRGKEFISIIYPPYEEELNEQKFDDSERKKAEKYARSNDEVLLTDALGRFIMYIFIFELTLDCNVNCHTKHCNALVLLRHQQP